MVNRPRDGLSSGVSRQRQILQQAIADSIVTFSAHRLRTLLTSLGVIFGVAAVISMLAIAEGAKRDAIASIEELGLTNIFVIEKYPNGDAAVEARKKNPSGLTTADGEAIGAIVPGIISVVPQVRRSMTVRSEHAFATFEIGATTRDFFDATNRSLNHGRLLNWMDEETEARVAVIGSEVARTLFPAEAPLGKFVRIGNEPYRVVGVMKAAGRSFPLPGLPDWEPDKDIYLPLKTTIRRISNDGGRDKIQVLLVRMESEQAVRSATPIMRSILDRRHREASDYTVVVPEELLAQSQRTQRTFTIIMGAIAGISLIVGGIGIMNIMLSSVLERTVEIGIRRAIGATQKEIARQFLTEATLLSGGGGIIGLILGMLLAYSVTWLAGWQTVITFWSVLVSLGVAVGVGIVFGMFPARQAAKLDPIEALRYAG